MDGLLVVTVQYIVLTLYNDKTYKNAKDYMNAMYPNLLVCIKELHTKRKLTVYGERIKKGNPLKVEIGTLLDEEWKALNDALGKDLQMCVQITKKWEGNERRGIGDRRKNENNVEGETILTSEKERKPFIRGHRSKALDYNQVAKVKRMYADGNGMSKRAIAREMGVSPPTILEALKDGYLPMGQQ